MKILFYDIRKNELDYLVEKIPNAVEPYFFKTNLCKISYIDEKFLDADAISVFVSCELKQEVLSKFKNLKFIFLRSVGYSNVDLEYCKKNNIYVFNAPNYGNSTVAEYVFALILALSKKIATSIESVKNGEIDSSKLTGMELFNKKIGVIGAGAIGRKVINIAHGFNMDVMVYDVNQKGAYNFVSLEELLKKSDIVSINCPLNSSTKGMINKSTISLMKKDAILINAARGEIVDTQALYFALVENKIKGAALDVVECEEYLCHHWKKCCDNLEFASHCLKKFFFVQRLLQLPNVIITPHNAYNTKEAQKRILDITLANIRSSFNINDGANNLVLI